MTSCDGRPPSEAVNRRRSTVRTHQEFLGGRASTPSELFCVIGRTRAVPRGMRLPDRTGGPCGRPTRQNTPYPAEYALTRQNNSDTVLVPLSGSPYRVPGSEGVSPSAQTTRARRPRSQAAQPHTDFRDAVLVRSGHLRADLYPIWGVSPPSALPYTTPCES